MLKHPNWAKVQLSWLSTRVEITFISIFIYFLKPTASDEAAIQGKMTAQLVILSVEKLFLLL